MTTSPGNRCDQILALIDACLADCRAAHTQATPSGDDETPTRSRHHHGDH